MSRSSSHAHTSHSSHEHDEHHHPGLTVTVEKEKGRAQVTLSVAATELEHARLQEFGRLGRNVALKGFRPGKTPRALLEKHFGNEVEKNVLEHFLQHAVDRAVKEHGLRPASSPRIPQQDPPAKGAAWSVTFTLLLRPEFTLGQLEGLAIEARSVAVDEAELDRALAEIRQSNARAEPAGDEPLAADGMCVATLDFFRAGSEESSLARENIRLTPKSAPQGVDPASFEEALLGARAGDERWVDFEFPPNFPLEEARGEKGRVRLALTEVLRIVPPSDEELFKAFEASDEASLRAAVRARMQTAKAEGEEQRIEAELLERVIEAHPMELPEELVQQQVEAQQAELIERLKEQGLEEAEAKKRADSERERSRAGAEKGLRALYLIEEIARAKNLQVTQEELAARLKAIAERNKSSMEEVAKFYREQGLQRQLLLEMVELKVRRHLRTSAALQPAT